MRTSILLMVLMMASVAAAEPLRLAVLSFEDRTGGEPARSLGAVDSEALAERGSYLLGKSLVGEEELVLVDRRTFLDQIQAGQGPGDTRQPSYLRAAQLVNADAVIRGSLISLSTASTTINLGGHASEHLDMTVRVSLEALDATDGSVLAVADGKSTQRIRQTDAVQTQLGDDLVLGMMDEALTPAVGQIRDTLVKRRDSLMNRDTATLTITSPDGPALVELNGVLIGSTPVEAFTVYQGDHVLTVGRPGYRDVTKRILVNQDLAVEVPLLKNELDADQIKEVLETSRLNIYQGLEPALLIETIQRTE